MTKYSYRVNWTKEVKTTSGNTKETIGNGVIYDNLSEAQFAVIHFQRQYADSPEITFTITEIAERNIPLLSDD